MATYDSIQTSIELVLDILDPETNTSGPVKTYNEHIIELGTCIKELNDIVRILEDKIDSIDDRVIILETP